MLLSKVPADVRHTGAENNSFDLCNSRAHPTFFAGRSKKPAGNLPKVHFWPEIFCLPAGINKGRTMKALPSALTRSASPGTPLPS